MNSRTTVVLRQLLILSMVIAMISSGSVHAARKRVAVVRVSTAKLRSAPSEGKRAIGLLDRGDTFAVVGQSDGWIKLRTESGKQGWVRADLVRLKTAAKPAEPRQNSKRSPKGAPAAVRTAVKRSQGSSSVRKRTASAKQSSAAVTSKPTTAVKTPLPVVERTNTATPVPTADPLADPVRPSAVPEAGDAAKSVAGIDTEDFLPVVAEPEVALEAPVDRIGRARASLVEDALSVYRQETSVNRSSTSRTALVSRAKSLRGTPYRFGSTGRGSFDCSGFTQHLYRRQGLSIPRTAAEQFHNGTAVGRMSLRQGDLVFFRNTGGRRGISHVGLFLGSGRFIHASSRGGGVRIDSLNESYYANHYAGARRFLR